MWKVWETSAKVHTGLHKKTDGSEAASFCELEPADGSQIIMGACCGTFKQFPEDWNTCPFWLFFGT